MSVPPGLTPPLGVEEVPGVVGLVADEDVALVGVLVVGVVELLVDVLLDVDDEVLLGVDLVVEVLEVLQFWAASCATVPAPWLRFCERVVLTVDGRLVTALVSAADALLAAPHWWAATAEEIEFSWLVRLLL
ncbi:MAG: hypothetical protein WAU75_01195 [Solirubrobacteraceae bacterium]